MAGRFLSNRLRCLLGTVLFLCDDGCNYYPATKHSVVYALDDRTPSKIATRNGWKSIEVMTEGESKGPFAWIMPGRMDGIGAFVVDNPSTPNGISTASSNQIIRIHVNHELDTNASISEINIYKSALQEVVANKIQNRQRNNPEFVRDVRLAYFRWSDDGGRSFYSGQHVQPNEAGFCKFCSGQSYKPNTFGPNRGFVDQIYITGEECPNGALFALDVNRRTLYKLSGYAGNSGTSHMRGIPYDPWENAALVDTGETNHIALMLSPDGDHSTTRYLQFYIGHKGKDRDGNTGATDFLSRNGLAYGEYFYLQSTFPRTGNTNRGGKFVQDSNAEILGDGKLEDIDTNPNQPNQVVLAESDTGLFIFDFDLVFDNQGQFDVVGTSFTIKKIDTGDIPWADNVEWSANGMIYINEDSDAGGIWYQTPEGRHRTKIGQTTTIGESAGIFDLSEFVDYPPGQIMITSSMEYPASLTILINPDARTLAVVDDGSSSQPGLDSDADGSETMIYFQAEDALTLYRASIATLLNGYTGNGYADMQGRGSHVEWTIPTNMIVGGAYELYISYATPSDSPILLYVDGSIIGAFDCQGTSNSGQDWAIESKEIVLTGGGDHTIKLMTVPSDGPNIDWVALRSSLLVVPPPNNNNDNIGDPEEGETAPPDPMHYEAEDGHCDICRIDTYRSGFTGDGYVDFKGNHAYVEWSVPIAMTGTYEVAIRYATPSDRPADLLLDGTKVANLDFDDTGGWTKWLEETFNIEIPQGVHTLKIDVGTKSSGPNVDSIEIRYLYSRRRHRRGRRAITREVVIPAEEKTAR